MKFMLQNMGQTGLLISICVMVTACNPDEYFPTQEFIDGIDAYCAEAKDIDSCSHQIGCQPAYNDSTNESAELVFSACVANPDFLPPSDGSTTGGSTTGGTSGVDDGSSTGGTTDGTISTPPTIQEALQSKCAELDDRYMYVKTLVRKKVSTTVSKVKVCHLTGNGSSHTIIIACPALNAHKQHHDDYLGSCEL